MKELREKLHNAIEEYGTTDERTISISQELDKVVCKEQKKLINRKKDWIWVACTDDKYELPVGIGATARELALHLGVNYESMRCGATRKGKFNGLKIIKVDVSRELFG